MLKVRDRIVNGARDYLTMQNESIEALNKQGFKTDYFEIRKANDLAVADQDTTDLVILVSAWLGKARLIDNIRVSI
jgi:pantoate--beta-alanine ligase